MGFCPSKSPLSFGLQKRSGFPLKSTESPVSAAGSDNPPFLLLQPTAKTTGTPACWHMKPLFTFVQGKAFASHCLLRSSIIRGPENLVIPARHAGIFLQIVVLQG